MSLGKKTQISRQNNILENDIQDIIYTNSSTGSMHWTLFTQPFRTESSGEIHRNDVEDLVREINIKLKWTEINYS